MSSIQLHLNEEGYEIEHNDRQTYNNFSNIEKRLIPAVVQPYRRSKTALVNLWDCIQTVTQHNAKAALFTFGSVAMNLHFQTIVEYKGGAPIVVLYGEPDTGKTSVANAAMSCLGVEACMFRGLCREYFLHLAQQTSLVLFYDNPNHVQEIESIIVDFYNGMTRGSFKRGFETPRCGFMLACNFTLGKIQRWETN